ncbi:MAG: hypothetical protein JW910_15485 [Anaerolineae bacterium]|nr:hypothetical protein [Anaerolineae bacterium]
MASYYVAARLGGQTARLPEAGFSDPAAARDVLHEALERYVMTRDAADAPLLHWLLDDLAAADLAVIAEAGYQVVLPAPDGPPDWVQIWLLTDEAAPPPQASIREMIRDGVLLPWRLYFQPLALVREFVAYRQHAPRQAIRWLLGQYAIALLWVPLLLLLTYILTPRAYARPAVVIALALMAGGTLLLFANWFRGGLLWGLTYGIGLGVWMAATAGIAAIMLSAIAIDQYGVATPDAIAQVVDGTTDLPVMPVYGAMVGLVLAVFFGVKANPQQAMKAGLIVGGFLVATLVLMPVLAPSARGAEVAPGNVIFAVTALLVLSHVIVWPLQALISLVIWPLAAGTPDRIARLWRALPVMWDYLLLAPMPGTVRLLVRLYRQDPVQGRAAISQLAMHPFQAGQARRVVSRLAAGG